MSTLLNSASILQIRLTKGSITNFLQPEEVLTTFVWIQIVIDELLPISSVESATAQRHSSIDAISRSTLTQYFQALSKNVEQNFIFILPGKFAIVFL